MLAVIRKLGVHHGVAVFGLVQIFSTLPHLLHGIKEVNEGYECFCEETEKG